MGIFLFCILVICIIGGIAYFTFRTANLNVDVQSILLDFCRLRREQIAEDIQGIELEHQIGHISESQVYSRVNSLKILIDKIVKLEKSFPTEFEDLNRELNNLFLSYESQKEVEHD